MLDAVVIGAGGAGLSAAISLSGFTDKFVVVTSGSVGHSNSVKAHGGIQFPVLKEDSAETHFEDSYLGGNYKASQELLRVMTRDSSNVLNWLKSLGLSFDTCGNQYIVKNCEGISVPRVLSVGLHTGSSIVKVLYSELKRRSIKIVEWATLKAVRKKEDIFHLYLSHKNNDLILKSKYVILCCGGKSKEHAEKNGYGTTNQPVTDFQFYKSLEDIDVKFLLVDSFQYHPTCITIRNSLFGLPVPEPLKVLGAKLYDKEGNVIQMSGLKRDELSVKLFDAIREGRAVKTEKTFQPSFLLDIKNILESGSIIADSFGPFFKKLINHGVDPYKEKIPVAPMVHYQNGGIRINAQCETSINGLYAAGEITGGIHGTDRLMGNSLLDMLVFGRIAGESCGKIISGGLRLES